MKISSSRSHKMTFPQLFLLFVIYRSLQVSAISTNRDEFGRCKQLLCPEECTVRYKGGCPYNCNCGEFPSCPRIHCPRPEPECLILTQLDGCQTCGCKDPVVVLEDENGKKQTVFVTVRYLTWREGQDLVREKKKLERERLRNSNHKAVVLETFATRITKIPIDGTVDPSVFENALIDSFQNNGSLIQRHNHFMLIETEVVEPRREPDPTDASSQTDRPGSDSTDGVPANCTNEYRTYIDKKFKPMFWELSRRRDPVADATFPYPLVFKYSRSEVLTACQNFWNIMRITDQRIMDTCKGSYGRLDEVLKNYEYPCGHQSQRAFFRDYTCLYQTRKRNAIEACENKARYFLEDPFLNRCDIYTILADCVYDTVMEECGSDAWENQFKFMSHVAKYHDPYCRVLRPHRENDPFQT